MQIDVQHSSGPKEVFQVNKDIVKIGRSTKCDVQIHYPGISREHILISYKDGELFVTDLGSTNGVFIDGVRVAPHTSVMYHNYLHLVAGETTITISLPLDTTGSFNNPTKVLAAPPRADRAQPIRVHDAKKFSKVKKSAFMPYVFASALAGGMVYYYQTKEVPVVAQPAITVVKKTFSIPANFEEVKTYTELWSEGGCKTSEEKTICSQLKEVWFPREGVLIKDNVYIFVNLSKEMAYRGIATEDLKGLAQILMSNLTTHPLIRVLEKPTYALGFIEENDKSELKFVLTQNMKGIPVLDVQLHRSVFSRAMVGEEWLFQKIIQPDLAIKPL